MSGAERALAIMAAGRPAGISNGLIISPRPQSRLSFSCTCIANILRSQGEEPSGALSGRSTILGYGGQPAVL